MQRWLWAMVAAAMVSGVTVLAQPSAIGWFIPNLYGSAGNVGIGITIPEAPLHVKSANATAGGRVADFANTAGTMLSFVTLTNNQLHVQLRAGGTMEFSVSGGATPAVKIDANDNVTFGGWIVAAERSVEAVSTTKTTTLAESFEVYTNTGDTDGSTITLLNDPTIGAQYSFVATAAQTVTILASAGETLESSGATCGTSITLTDGQSVTVVAATGGSGAQWHVLGGVGFTCNA